MGVLDRVVQQIQQHKIQQYKEKYPALDWAIPVLWLLAIGSITLVWRVGSIGLIDETEPLFVEASRQMTLTGDWITPYFDGETRFDKPPLIYWLMVIAFQIFGINEFAARLPSVLAAFAIVFLCFHTLQLYGEAVVRRQEAGGRRQEAGDETNATLSSAAAQSATQNSLRLGFDVELSRNELRSKAKLKTLSLHRKAEASYTPLPSPVRLSAVRLSAHVEALSPYLPAYLGATMLLLNPNTFFWGRTGYSDMLLTACMGGSLLAFFLGYAQPENPIKQRRWYFTFYVCMALAVLTKGPIGMILPGLIIGCFLLYLGNGGEVLREMQVIRGGLVVLAIAFPWYVLVTLANGEAFIDSFFGYHNVERFTQVVNHHAGAWYFHILVILVGFLPWSAYLPAALVKPLLNGINIKLLRPYWQTRSRLQQLGLFAAVWFVVILGFFTLATTKYFSYTLPLMPAAAILVALLWTDYITLPQTRKQHGFVLSGVLNLVLLLVIMGAVVYCPHWLGSDPWMPNLGVRIQQAGLPVVGGVIWGATAIAAIVLLWRRSHWLWLANLLGFMAFLVLVVHPMLLIADAERQLPLRQIAQVVMQTKQPTEDLIMLGFKKPSLVYYTRQHVTYLTQPAKVIPYLEKQAGDSTSALIVAGDTPLVKSGLQPNQYQKLSRAGVYRLVRVASLR